MEFYRGFRFRRQVSRRAAHHLEIDRSWEGTADEEIVMSFDDSLCQTAHHLLDGFDLPGCSPSASSTVAPPITKIFMCAPYPFGVFDIGRSPTRPRAQHPDDCAELLILHGNEAYLQAILNGWRTAKRVSAGNFLKQQIALRFVQKEAQCIEPCAGKQK